MFADTSTSAATVKTAFHCRFSTLLPFSAELWTSRGTLFPILIGVATSLCYLLWFRTFEGIGKTDWFDESWTFTFTDTFLTVLTETNEGVHTHTARGGLLVTVFRLSPVAGEGAPGGEGVKDLIVVLITCFIGVYPIFTIFIFSISGIILVFLFKPFIINVSVKLQTALRKIYTS
jgi:hypothetical protein